MKNISDALEAVGCIYFKRYSSIGRDINDHDVEQLINTLLQQQSKMMILYCSTNCTPCNKLKKFIVDNKNNIISKLDILIINYDKSTFNMDFFIMDSLGKEAPTSLPTTYCIDWLFTNIDTQEVKRSINAIQGFTENTKQTIKIFCS